MSTSADSLSNLEHRAEQSISDGINWTVHAAGDAYKATKSLVPLPEEYKDVALAGAALVAGAVACKPLQILFREVDLRPGKVPGT
jgi:hypothetical protein